MVRIVQSVCRRLRSLLTRETSNRALREELEFHLEQAANENIARGMSPQEAWASARQAFGSVTHAADQCYEARGVGWLEDLAHDIRFGMRTFARYRSFAALTVLTLALGIGACTAVFSLFYAVLLHSLPYPQA